MSIIKKIKYKKLSIKYKKLSNCKECEIEKIRIGFCCKDCEIFYITRKTDIKEVEIETLKEEIETLKELPENKEETEKETYTDGYYDGLMDYIKQTNICPYCKDHCIESIHHLIPRNNNGSSDPLNLIALCFKCHDEIEILTYDLIKYEYKYNSQILRDFITNHNFPIYHSKKLSNLLF